MNDALDREVDRRYTEKMIQWYEREIAKIDDAIRHSHNHRSAMVEVHDELVLKLKKMERP